MTDFDPHQAPVQRLYHVSDQAMARYKDFAGPHDTHQFFPEMNHHGALPPAYLVEDPRQGVLGLLSVFAPHPGEAEFSLTVGSPWRGRGLGKRLLAAAVADWHVQGRCRILLVHDHRENTSLPVVERWAPELDHREWSLEHRGPRPSLAADPAWSLDQALVPTAVDEAGAILAASFDQDPAGGLAWARQMAGVPGRTLWMGRYEGRGMAVGSLHDEGDRWSINSLGVRPEWRGRGLGRRLLASLMERCPEGLCLSLDVDAVNERALGLYQSMGLVITRSVGYHILDPGPFVRGG